MGWLSRWFRASDPPSIGPTGLRREEHPGEADELEVEKLASDLVVELPITDALDLHTFRPAETADVVRAYLDAAIERGLREVRIIHGRGIGTQREIVRKVLARDPRVVAFADAPAGRGGWGATVAELRSDPEPAEGR